MGKELKEKIANIHDLALVKNDTGMGSNLTAAQAAIEVARTSGWQRAVELFYAR
jgi:hypothetical protein